MITKKAKKSALYLGMFALTMALGTSFEIKGQSIEDGGGCTKCETGTEECYRVIIGNDQHIFHGKAKEC